MTIHRLPGLRTTPLLSYLATLGLARSLAEQADPDMRLWWSGEEAMIESSVTQIAYWLANEYRPTPILSPWNEGSGFGTKDKKPKEVLDQLLALDDPRLDAFQGAYAWSADLGAIARAEKWNKGRVVAEFRNRCADGLLPWIDASVVLTADAATVFPPLLGTGGNDGRLDFSTNFHQRLIDVFLSSAGAERARGWAADLLEGSSDLPLTRGAVGQFDPVGSGGRNSSRFGAADGLVNPWSFILMVEGSLLFAAGVARRLSTQKGRAAMPFTVAFSPEGGGAGAVGEPSRGEIWAPTWKQPMSWPEVSQLFREARATWRGKSPTRAVQMYESARTLGVARGIDAFVRYGLPQRNGLAFVSVPIETVRVEDDPEIALAATYEDWLERAGRFTNSNAIAVAIRSADAAHLAFAREGGGERLAEFLASITRVEQAVGRSRQAFEKLPPAPRPPNSITGQVLHLLRHDAARPSELRIAVALASAIIGTEAAKRPEPTTRRLNLRHLLLPVRPAGPRHEDWAELRVPGFGVRPLVDCLADAFVTRMRLAPADPHPVLGALAAQWAWARAPWPDVHSWLRSELSDRHVQRYLLAVFRLRWDEKDASLTLRAGRGIPDPGLAMLEALGSGLVAGRTSDSTPTPTSQADRDPDGPASASRPPRVGLRPDWPVRLRSGQAQPVIAEAAQRLRQYGWRTTEPMAARVEGARYAAAALVPVSGIWPLLATVGEPPDADPNPETQQVYRPVEVLP